MRVTALAVILGSVVACGVAPAAEQVVEVPGARVTYTGVSARWATAIGRVTAGARQAAAAWGFDVPATVHVQVTCRSGQEVRLFNGGKERAYLSVRSEQDLRKPSVTGTYHLYGLCHEVGHLAQYRPALSGTTG